MYQSSCISNVWVRDEISSAFIEGYIDSVEEEREEEEEERERESEAFAETGKPDTHVCN